MKETIIQEYLNGSSIGYLSNKYKKGHDTISSLLGKHRRTASEASKLVRKNKTFKHTEVSRQKSRESRLKWMKENPEKTAWRSKNPSYIEVCFSSYLFQYQWGQEFKIIQEKSIFPYFIDFAFENEWIAVELDGSQHLEIKQKEKDNVRDSILNSLGWTVYRISGASIVKNLDVTMQDLHLFLKKRSTSISNKQVGFDLYKSKNRKGRTCKSGKFRTEKENLASFAQRKVKDRPDLQHLKLDIDLLGYVGTGRKYSVSDNAVRKWLLNYEKAL